MSSIFRIEREENHVTLFSVDRMPHNSRKTRMDSARSVLRKAISELIAGPDEIIEGVYSSQIDAYFDIENVVFYNIVPSTFRNSAYNGLLARRCRLYQESENPGFPHKMEYRLIPKPQLPISSSVQLSFTPHSFRNVFDVWWAAGMGKVSGNKPINGAYGMYVTLDIPNPPRNPAGILKILFDGIIAALQQDQNPDTLAVMRLSQINQVAEALVEHRLKNPVARVIPASRSTHLVRPYRTKIQWHPADDLCEECTLIVTESSTPRCNAYIYSLANT